MHWLSLEQAPGYLGSALMLFNVWYLGNHQKSDNVYWIISLLANLSWILCGVLIGSGAVIAEGAIWCPLVLWGWWRYHKGSS